MRPRYLTPEWIVGLVATGADVHAVAAAAHIEPWAVRAVVHHYRTGDYGRPAVVLEEQGQLW